MESNSQFRTQKSSWYITLFHYWFFSLSWPLLRSECTNFREFWPVLSDVPTHHFGERSAVKISTFFTLIISLFCAFSELLSLSFLRSSLNLGFLPCPPPPSYIGPWPGRKRNPYWTKYNLTEIMELSEECVIC